MLITWNDTKAFISESEEKLSADYIEFLNDNTRNEAPGNENWTRVYEIAHQIITLVSIY